jgi:putative endonuclease
MAHAHTLGQAGELIAEGFLRLWGFDVSARRLRLGPTEIDLLAEGQGAVVVVEVKLRRGRRFGGARSAVGAEKRRHLIEAATRYLSSRPAPHPPVRFDVIAITLDDRTRTASVEHVPNAFQARSGTLV